MPIKGSAKIFYDSVNKEHVLKVPGPVTPKAGGREHVRGTRSSHRKRFTTETQELGDEKKGSQCPRGEAEQERPSQELGPPCQSEQGAKIRGGARQS